MDSLPAFAGTKGRGNDRVAYRVAQGQGQGQGYKKDRSARTFHRHACKGSIHAAPKACTATRQAGCGAWQCKKCKVDQAWYKYGPRPVASLGLPGMALRHPEGYKGLTSGYR